MQDLIEFELNSKALYYECGLYIRFLKILKHSALRKTEATEVINFGFSKPEKEKFISSKKLLLILKILWTRRKNIT